jgi:hypothetical protein
VNTTYQYLPTNLKGNNEEEAWSPYSCKQFTARKVRMALRARAIQITYEFKFILKILKFKILNPVLSGKQLRHSNDALCAPRMNCSPRAPYDKWKCAGTAVSGRMQQPRMMIRRVLTVEEILGQVRGFTTAI